MIIHFNAYCDKDERSPAAELYIDLSALSMRIRKWLYDPLPRPIAAPVGPLACRAAVSAC